MQVAADNARQTQIKLSPLQAEVRNIHHRFIGCKDLDGKRHGEDTYEAFVE
jgi:hypothetical protein